MHKCSFFLFYFALLKVGCCPILFVQNENRIRGRVSFYARFLCWLLLFYRVHSRKFLNMFHDHVDSDITWLILSANIFLKLIGHIHCAQYVKTMRYAGDQFHLSCFQINLLIRIFNSLEWWMTFRLLCFRVGDRILSVNGLDCDELDYDQVIDQIRRIPRDVELFVLHRPDAAKWTIEWRSSPKEKLIRNPIWPWNLSGFGRKNKTKQTQMGAFVYLVFFDNDNQISSGIFSAPPKTCAI